MSAIFPNKKGSRAKPQFVELHARSAFSFLRSASQPEELARQAAALGMHTIGMCDRDGLYGAPRLYAAAREAGVRAVVGAELTMEEGGGVLPVLVRSRQGYQNLSRLITRSKLRGSKAHAPVAWSDLEEFAEGLVCLTGDEEGGVRMALEQRENPKAAAFVQRLKHLFGPENVYMEIQRHRVRGEEWVNDRLVQLARAEHLPLLATNGPLYAEPARRKALDLFTCIRHHTHFDAAGLLLSRNGERVLKTAEAMGELFADLPEALETSVRLASELEFTLENLGYEFPSYPVPEGETMNSFLRKMTMAGARARYTHLGGKVRAQLERELALIEKLGFAGYFLIVWDIANFCTTHDILMQGRGSAANSAVCYSLGITACDPIANKLLFERFLSEGRKGWPDIDLDLPSGERRERVIQELYQRYGKHGAAMTANVITYRGKSAMREIGKALNLAPDVVTRFSDLFAGGDYPHTLEIAAHMEKAGLPREHPRAGAFIELYQQIYGLPRHLGQHSGGMIICQGLLDSMVPLEPASMPGRVVAQWDKDDCEDLGIIKVDLLGLGMMAVLQEGLELCRERGHAVEMAALPREDEAVYKLMQEADTIGIFQIESRAQMATLPRMKPQCFYDIVIEVAIIRPGPIQGDLVHPYLNRRTGREAIDYIHPLLEPVLERTLGVPLFQEQILKMAMVVADFSGDEAEELRRALSFHRSQERMQKVLVKLRAAMERKGIDPEAIEKIVRSVTSFALYGFPESHAISFANLVWTSAWMKVHRPVEFFTALFNNQPMGFYSPATLLRDGKRHGVRFKPISALYSHWKCTVTEEGAIRLGFCLVRGLNAGHVQAMVETRAERPFASLHDFRLRTQWDRDELRTLARIGALNGLAEHRRDALWRVEEGLEPGDLFTWGIGHGERQAGLSLSEGKGTDEPKPDQSFEMPLVPMTLPERLGADYHGTGLSVGTHPMALVRPHLSEVWRAKDLRQVRHGQWVTIGGAVICRQRPGTAKGFVFVSLEDETGIANAIVAPALFERLRLLITQEPFLLISGMAQNMDNVVSIKASDIQALSFSKLEQIGGVESHDFH